MSEEIKQFISREMATLGMDDEKFHAYLNEGFSKEGDSFFRSKTTVLNMRVHGRPPKIERFQDMLSVYPVHDRRFFIALNMLALISPHIWGFGGVVWNLKKDAQKLVKAE